MSDFEMYVVLLGNAIRVTDICFGTDRANAIMGNDDNKSVVGEITSNSGKGTMVLLADKDDLGIPFVRDTNLIAEWRLQCEAAAEAEMDRLYAEVDRLKSLVKEKP